MKPIRMLLSVFAVMLGVICAYPETSQDAVKLLNKLSNAYRELRNYKITGVSVNEERRGDYHSLTEVPFTMAEARPGKFRFESSGAPFSASSLVSDGVQTSQYVGMRRQYTIQPAATAKLAELPLGFKPPDYVKRYSHLAENTTSATWLREEDLSFQGKNVRCAVLQVVPKSDSEEGDSAPPTHTFWIDKSTFLVLKESWEVPAKDDDGPYIDHKSILYKQIQAGGALDSALFTFVPPNNSRQVDEMIFPWSKKTAKAPELTGKDAPEFVAVSATGEKTSLQSLQGKAVLLDFWATWCEPCRASEPLIHKLSEKFKDKGLVVLGINFGEESKAVSGYMKHNPSPFTIYLDQEQKIAKSYGVDSIPKFILISKDGKVADIVSDFGDDTEAKLNAALKNVGVEP